MSESCKEGGICLSSETTSEKVSGLVSVIIPVYNVCSYLEEALDSAVHQTYHNLEIIVIDDGSDDGSGEICDRYAESDSRIRVIHQYHQGVSVCRNVGLDTMRGEYIAFLDSDDALYPETVETLLKAMKQEQADLAVYRYAECHTETRLNQAGKEEINPPYPPGVYERGEYLRTMLDGPMLAYLWNKLYRAELWEGIRFPAGRVFEDIAMIWRICSRARLVVVLPEILYLYRRHSGTITQTMNLQNFRDWLAAIRAYDDYVEQNTPDLFAEEQLQKTYRVRMEKLVWAYARYPVGEMMPDEAELLRKWINDLGQKTRGRGRGFRVWFGWQLFRLSPGLLRIMYSPYYAVYAKHMEKKH